MQQFQESEPYGVSHNQSSMMNTFRNETDSNRDVCGNDLNNKLSKRSKL